MSIGKSILIIGCMEYKSLYDWFGNKPVGFSTTAKRVAGCAYALKVDVQKRYVSNKAYTGTVNIFPVAFLEKYFSNTFTPEEQATIQPVIERYAQETFEL